MSSQESNRLNSLPDEILTHIFSFLLTKSAAATSILSRPWRYLWRQVTALRFTVDDLSSEEFFALYFCILRRVTWPKVHIIELTFKAHEGRNVARNAARFTKRVNDIVFGDYVKELKLNVDKSGDVTDLMEIPHLIFQKKSLEVLEIGYGFRFGVKGGVKLPNLRKLVIKVCDKKKPDLVQSIVKFCPSLQILEIESRHGLCLFDEGVVKLPKLWKLIIHVSSYLDLVQEFLANSCPLLQILGIHIRHGFRVLDNGGVNLPNLRKLNVNVNHHMLNVVKFLVESCPLLQNLGIYVDIIEKSGSKTNITSPNLRWLSINLVGYHGVGRTISTTVVLDAPKLEFLDVRSPSMVIFKFLKTPRSLNEAKLFIEDGEAGESMEAYQVKVLLNSILCARTLSLGGDILKHLTALEKFHKLTHLEMVLSCSSGLETFLQKCPNLQSLVLRKDCETRDDMSWSTRGILPDWLKTKIQRVELRNFDGFLWGEFQFIAYILYVAEELKLLDIWIDASQAKNPSSRDHFHFHQTIYM